MPIYNKLNNHIETDVLIIGGGLISGMCAFIFKNYGIKVTIVERLGIESTVPKDSQNLIDEDLKTILPIIHEVKHFELFRFSLETLYILDDIIKQLDSQCDYTREPSFIYSQNVDEKMSDFKLPFSKGLYYNSGARLNPNKLCLELYDFFEKQDIDVYENTEIYELNMENNKIDVTTTDKWTIKSKKVLITSEYESQLFFDQPVEHLDKSMRMMQKLLIPRTEQTVDLRYDRELVRGIEPRSYRLEFNSFDIIEQLNPYRILNPRHLPYIRIDNNYPNVFLNINRGNKVIFGLMGALLFLNDYLEIDDTRLTLFNFDRF